MVHNMVILYLYTFQDDQSDESNCHLPPYKDTTIIINYILHTIHFISMTHLFYN